MNVYKEVFKLWLSATYDTAFNIGTALVPMILGFWACSEITKMIFATPALSGDSTIIALIAVQLVFVVAVIWTTRTLTKLYKARKSTEIKP